MKIISQRLKYLRETRNLTQPEAGEIVGVQYRTYQKYEYNDATPSISMLIQFAGYYKVSFAYIIGITDDETICETFQQTSNLIERLKILRSQTGITQKEVADRIEMPYKTYQNYELGLRTPNIETLCKLAAFYGVSVDYLVGLDVTE